jgi:hypothetical protein
MQAVLKGLMPAPAAISSALHYLSLVHAFRAAQDDSDIPG